jgi:SAM-dependent methyltransferase
MFPKPGGHFCATSSAKACSNVPENRTDQTCAAFMEDMTHTLTYLGLDAARAKTMGDWIVRKLLQEKPLAEIELEIFEKLKNVVVDFATGRKLIDAIEPGLAGRAELIFTQLQPFLYGLHGKRILDFGAGDGGVTQLLHDKLSPHTVGIDVCAYGKSRVPIMQYDGRVAPFPDESFDAIVSTNVLHHVSDNQQCLSEFQRLLKRGGRAIVIETVPLGATEQEAVANLPLTFLNDYLYNRILHHADIPVPGTFETMKGWRRRFEGMGFMVKDIVGLGIDQPLIRDPHCILDVAKPAGNPL